MGETALLIESDPREAKLARLVLEAEGWTVMHVTRVSTACVLLRSERPSIIVTDLALSDGRGVIVLEILHAVTTTIPVVVVTALDGPETEHRALSAGATAYIHKPIDVTRFAEQLRSILKGSR